MGVLIIGAGPAGLVLANVVAAHGVPVRIIDRDPGPVAESRAAIIHVRTLELLDRIGVRERVMAEGVSATTVEVHQRGRLSTRFPLASPAAAGATPLLLTQDRTERLLIDALASRDVRVRWNTELTSLRDGVAVVRRPGGEERIEADWIVGADGASSRVRGELGLDFAGKTYEQAGMLADVQLDRPPERGTLRLNLTRGGFVGILDLGNGDCRLFGALPPKLAPASSTDGVSHDPYAGATLPDIQRWFDELFDVDATVTRVTWAALFRIHSRMTRRFRAGSVFLVGDAAHVHSPAGGQGLNLGIGDAVNLGWKLGLVAAGRADPGLLDSYEAERLPVARNVLRGTDRGFALEATDSPVGVWLRSHLAPHAIGPLLRLRPVRARIAELFAQTWIRYPHSPIVAGPGGGDRTQPGEVPADLHHHLLVPDEKTRDAGRAALRHHRLDERIHLRPGTGQVVRLVRPDGHLGFTGPVAALPGYLDRVYGTPTTRHVS
jgi:2-polyprenyl-6-methoxyphenol hydroxylase-like FAD-dependent oxidoreductase